MPGNGRRMFRFQKGRVEFRRKPLTFVYDFVCRRKKCYLTHSWWRGERKRGNREGQGLSLVLAPEKTKAAGLCGFPPTPRLRPTCAIRSPGEAPRPNHEARGVELCYSYFSLQFPSRGPFLSLLSLLLFS